MIKGKAAYLNRLYAKMKFKSVELGEKIDGSTPPAVFVGKWNYPRVFAGPLIPPIHGNTQQMDLPEEWFKTGKTAQDVINFRFALVRGKETIDVHDVQSRNVRSLQEIALAKSSFDIEAEFKKKPRGAFFREDVQPFGPSAPLKNFTVGNIKMEHHLEKFYYDTDLLSKEAVIDLYYKGIPVSTIQKALSVGSFGVEKNRRLVPSRWSITAVDGTLGLHLLKKVKTYPTIDEYRVYEYENINNKFVILLLPTHWQYEAMEAWFPQIIGDKLEIYGDYEKFEGKKGYALIGGCWYAERLSASEALEREKRQAGVIIFRESYPGYTPLGVWNCREAVRLALKKSFRRFDSLRQSLDHISTRLRIPEKEWVKQSYLLKDMIIQKNLNQFANQIKG